MYVLSSNTSVIATNPHVGFSLLYNGLLMQLKACDMVQLLVRVEFAGRVSSFLQTFAVWTKRKDTGSYAAK